MNKNDPVIIVGAGLSGLRAASLLVMRGIPCRVLEARDRIGGRVLSQEVKGRPDLGSFDLGPTWFWPQYEPAIRDLVNELGLETFEQYNQGFFVSERSQHALPQRHLLPEGAVESSLRIVGGVQMLTDAVAQTLPKGIVELNTKVSSIHMRADGSLAIKAEGRKEEILASSIILALPPRIIARNLIFVPELSAELKKSLMNKPTWMAAQAKVVAIYERPFWREQGFSGFATSWVGPLQEIHEASPVTGAGALFGFFGIPAKKRIELGERSLLKSVQEQLTRLFGPLAENNIALLYKDWSSDQETSSAGDTDPIRDYPRYGLPGDLQDWNNKIIFAGTETTSVQGGHLEGALQSADRAVFELIQRYKTDNKHR